MSYCSGCGYGGMAPMGGGNGYNSSAPGSSLEMAVAEYQPAIMMSEEARVNQSAEAVLTQEYKGSKDSYSEGMYLSNSPQKYYFTPEVFLRDIQTKFISCSDEHQKQLVSSLVEDAFKAATGKEVPKDIAIRICSEEKMAEMHKGWHPGIKGFSLNRRGFGVSEIFVKEDELARLMLTIGHEIGHVITLPMENAVDEEAKAFAFSLAWMDAVRENNIGELSEVIRPSPAMNGLHNIAFDFVVENINKGKTANDVYSELINREISINNRIPVF